jgi:hypothetical protein
METLEERHERVRKKATRHFIGLVLLVLALSAYIAFFTGDGFIEVSDQAPE